jgi:hypothetical protein
MILTSISFPEFEILSIRVALNDLPLETQVLAKTELANEADIIASDRQKIQLFMISPTDKKLLI